MNPFDIMARTEFTEGDQLLCQGCNAVIWEYPMSSWPWNVERVYNEHIKACEPLRELLKSMNTDQTPAAAPQVGAAAEKPFTVAVGQSVLYIPQPPHLDGPDGINFEVFPDVSQGMALNANTESQCRNGLPMAAIVTRVWNEKCVNLTVFPDYAPPFCASSVLPDDGNKNPRRFVV